MNIIGKYGYPHKFTVIVHQFHDGMAAHVLDDGKPTESFSVTNGMKQGCIQAPMLFNMMFSAMLSDALQNSVQVIDINYRSDGELYNLKRLYHQ